MIKHGWTYVNIDDTWQGVRGGKYQALQGNEKFPDMKKLCEETGGRVIRVGNKIEKLRDAFDQISNELRSQYSLAYTPTNNKRDGTFREIDIKSKEGHKIQARKGYYAPLQ